MSDKTKIIVKRRSDQWNNEDLAGGPRTFTIAAVRDGKAEGPYDIELVEGEGKVWRPPNSVLEALVLAWGTNERADWVGRKVTLYRDAEVRMGRDVVGGIRVSHVSHISKATTVRVTTARGKKSPVTLQPLPDSPTPAVVSGPSEADVAAATDKTVLAAWWKASSPEMRALIEARVAELGGSPMSRRDVIVSGIQSAAIPALIVGAMTAALLSPGRPGLTLLAVALAIGVFALIQAREHKLISARDAAFRDAEVARTHAETWRTTAHKEWMRRHLSESDARVANGGIS